MIAESTPRRPPASGAEDRAAHAERPSPRGGERGSDSVSNLLVDFGESWKEEQIDIGSLISALEHRGHGLLLVLFALPNVIPNPVPGLSAIFGIPLAIFSAQLILQQRQPWLPKWLGNRSIKRDSYRRIVGRAAPYLAKVERILRPRLGFMFDPLPIALMAGLCLVLSLLLTLPIPLTGMVLATPILLYGLALIQRDGICALVAGLLGNAAMIFAFIAGWAVFRGIGAAIFD
jgi:hypothetical protein